MNNPKALLYRARATNPTPIVAWDTEKVLNRLVNSGFITKVGNTWRGRSKLPWTTLEEPEILQRYNYIITGYLNYYTPVSDYPNDTHFLHYLLKFSCVHTLAQKRNCKLSDIFKKYGRNIIIKYKTKVSRFNKDIKKQTVEQYKLAKLLTWENCTNIIRNIIIKTRKDKEQQLTMNTMNVDLIPEVKINWRTKYKLSEHCAICGSTDNVEYHHVRHIKKGKVQGFLQIMNQLNRRQIPCCKKCHRNIHNGKYDRMVLTDISDEELIVI